MGGDEQEDPGALSPVEDQGSVGDWRLPDWMRHIPGLAWLFVGLAIVDFAVGLTRQISIEDQGAVDSGQILGLAARALPVLLPFVVIARSGSARLAFSDRLFAGSVAVALSLLLGTISTLVSVPTFLLISDGEVDEVRFAGAAALRLSATALGFVGPILLARSILDGRHVTAPRWALLAGVSAFVLAVVYIGGILTSAITVWTLNASLFSGALAVWTLSWVSSLLSAITYLGWAYLAWAILLTAGDRARPRLAWSLGLGAILLRQAGLVTYLATMWLISSVGDSPEAGPASDGLRDQIGTLFTAGAVLASIEAVLFTAAFGLGLGSPPVVESDDAEHVELDPLLAPG